MVLKHFNLSVYEKLSCKGWNIGLEYNMTEMNLAQIPVSWSTVKQRVDHFCVYFLKLRWFSVNLGQPVEQCCV